MNTNRALRSASLILVSVTLFACPPPKPTPTVVAVQPAAAATPVMQGSGPVSVETVTDSSGRTYQIQQGARGEPAVVGCADGQREAFVDNATFPNIAGCIASWDGATWAPVGGGFASSMNALAVADFGSGLDQPLSDITVYVALRETARQRLFNGFSGGAITSFAVDLRPLEQVRIGNHLVEDLL